MPVNIKNIVLHLKCSAFVKNMLIVMSGAAIAQIIGFALTPLLSRLFTPSDFGVLGSFNSIVGIIAAGITLEYTQAIILQKEKSDAVHLFVISCLCTIAVSFLLLLFCFVAPNVIQDFMKTSSTLILVMLFIATITAGINSALQAWCIWAKAFNQTSTSQVMRSLSANGIQLGFGYFRCGAPGLIIGSVIADLIASLNLFRVIYPDILAFWNRLHWSKIKILAKEYRDFPMYAATQNIVTTLSQGLPVLLLTNFFGLAIAGAYAFGVRILQAPMGLILRALRQVLLQKAGEIQYSGGRLMPLYIKITGGLFLLTFFPSLIFFVWAPQIFNFVFGVQWYTAGEFARSLILWLCVAFCNLPAVLFAQIIRIQRTVLFYDLFMLAGRATVLILGGIYFSASITIMLFSIFGALMNLFLIIIVGYKVMKKEGYLTWNNYLNTLLIK